MTGEPFSRYDSADYLRTEEDIAAYLEAVMAAGGEDPAHLVRALGTVARARDLGQLAQDLGTGDPSFSAVAKVAQALGLRLTLRPAGAS